MRTLNIPKSRPTNPPEVVDYIIGMAIKLDASDIHLAMNPYGKNDPYLLRFRVNGKLQQVKADFIGNQYKEVTSRIKVLAGMDISESKAPQDGQCEVEVPQGRLILRISSVPGAENEDIVIRIQKSWRNQYSLDSLQMAAPLKDKLYSLAYQKSGLIILNGPAGSGKTTTIYSIIGTLASPERKIITAEDPVEARIPFVSHTQVTHKTSFASLCRAFMRQDADVIFVGEIRDEESAEAAMQLAQTGHLVLTTIHTRDSIGVISRLEALKAHPSMIAATLIGSLSQRLVPWLCSDCRVPFAPKAADQRRIATFLQRSPLPAGAQLFQTGPGCPKCFQGVRGRLPVYELFMVDPDLAEMIAREESKGNILKVAKAKGMKTLSQDAWNLVCSGQVDLNSVMSYVLGLDTSDGSTPGSAAPAGSTASNQTQASVLAAVPHKRG